MSRSPRRVPGADGLSLQLLDGPGSGAPLLLCHGFGHSARIWDPFVPGLAERYRVLAYDARGHGDSDHDPEAGYSHPGLALDLERVADHLRLAELSLVGHSMGAYACMYFAAKHPHRVSRLVLAEASPDLSASAKLAARAAPRRSASPRFESPQDYAGRLARQHPKADPEVLAGLARDWLRPAAEGGFELKLDPRAAAPEKSDRARSSLVDDPEGWVRDEGARLWGFLEAIPCPTLVLRGERSPLVPAPAAERMAGQALRDGRLVTLPGAGHALMLDAPDAFRAALEDFLL